MRVLVLGGAGFIGLYLVKALKKEGHVVTNIDKVTGSDITTADITDGLPKKEFDAIVFLACNQEDSWEAYKENERMYWALDEYRLSGAHKKPYLIYISSAAVYNLTSKYALSKQLGEAYAARWGDNCAILRLSNVYGHGDGKGAPDRFKRGYKTIHGSGNQMRDLIPVELVVSKIMYYLNQLDDGTFNVSSGVGTSVNQMFELFGEGKPRFDATKSEGVFESILPPGPVDG